MESFKESIKAATKEEKILAMENMFSKVVMCGILLSQADPQECIEKSENILSEEEAIVTYELLRRIRILIELPSKYRNNSKNKILNFLDISNNEINNKEGLYEFVEFAVKDLEESRRKIPDKKWNLQIEKIINRIEKEKENKEQTKEDNEKCMEN